MAKFLFHVSYTEEGVKGVMKEGGTARLAAAQKLAQSLGGSIEVFYFAFGDTDVFTIGELPDHASAAALALTIAASGAVTVKTTVLMTPAEIDQASKKSPIYRPPGK